MINNTPPIKQLTLEDLSGIEMVCRTQMFVTARIIRLSLLERSEPKQPEKSGFLIRAFKRKAQPKTYSEEDVKGVSLLIEQCTKFVCWVNYLVSLTRKLHRDDISEDDRQYSMKLYKDACVEIEALIKEIEDSNYHGNKYAGSAFWQIGQINDNLLRDPPRDSLIQ